MKETFITVETQKNAIKITDLVNAFMETMKKLEASTTTAQTALQITTQLVSQQVMHEQVLQTIAAREEQWRSNGSERWGQY